MSIFYQLGDVVFYTLLARCAPPGSRARSAADARLTSVIEAIGRRPVLVRPVLPRALNHHPR
jgi:hypothetical protein